MLKLKAIERKLMVGPNAGKWAFVLQPELYSTLTAKKVIDEASIRSGVSRGILQAAWEAIGTVITSWATEGHSVAVPGLGTMRFGVTANSVSSVNDVASSLITSRKVIFTPSVDIKAELKQTAISITCIDRNGNIIKRVNSDNTIVDDGEQPGDGQFAVVLTSTSGGQATGAGNYDSGAKVTIKATPLQGYHFVKWSDGDTNATRELTMDKNYTLQAVFTADETDGGSDEGGLGA